MAARIQVRLVSYFRTKTQITQAQATNKMLTTLLLLVAFTVKDLASSQVGSKISSNSISAVMVAVLHQLLLVKVKVLHFQKMRVVPKETHA